MLEKSDRKWVKAIGAKLRDDLGDCPTLTEDMLRLMEHLASTRGGRQVKVPADATQTTAALLRNDLSVH